MQLIFTIKVFMLVTTLHKCYADQHLLQSTRSGLSSSLVKVQNTMSCNSVACKLFVFLFWFINQIQSTIEASPCERKHKRLIKIQFNNPNMPIYGRPATVLLLTRRIDDNVTAIKFVLNSLELGFALTMRFLGFLK